MLKAALKKRGTPKGFDLFGKLADRLDTFVGNPQHFGRDRIAGFPEFALHDGPHGDDGYGPVRFLTAERASSVASHVSADAFVRAVCEEFDSAELRSLAGELLAAIAEAAASERGLLVGIY